MAVTAVKIVARRGGTTARDFGLVQVGLIGMVVINVVIMVAQLLRLRAGLVPAIARHGRPAELERQEDKQ